jgi:hypothetical protein
MTDNNQNEQIKDSRFERLADQGCHITNLYKIDTVHKTSGAGTLP